MPFPERLQIPGGADPQKERKVYPEMKKLFAMMMALILALGCAAGLAEGTETREINWADVEPAVAEVDGGFVAMEDLGIQMWLPSVITATEITDELAQQGILYAFAANDGSAGVTVAAQMLPEGYTIEDYIAGMAEAGATEVETGIINGLNCCTFDMADMDASCVLYSYGENSVVLFSYLPMSDEGFKSTAQVIMCSVMEIPAE